MSQTLIANITAHLAKAQQELNFKFKQNVPITQLLHKRSDLIDEILLKLWRNFIQDTPNISLIATGGYGRRELHPFSDIDVLILLVDDDHQNLNANKISSFITAAWDVGLKVGHSVRSLKNCAKVAKKDLVLITSIMESRYLAGSKCLFEQLLELCSVDKMWDGKKFFLAKRRELKERHKKYANTEYNLEPNLKTSPGTLRDIQTILWVLQRFTDVQNILNQTEHYNLVQAQHFLWEIRYAIHLVANSPEERLLFNLQLEVAQILGFNAENSNALIEKLMHKYYRTVLEVSVISELVLLKLAEQLLTKSHKNLVRILDEDLQINGDYLELRNPHHLIQKPSLFLQVFVVLSQNPRIKGLNSTTIECIRRNLAVIDENFRRNSHYCALFMQIFDAKVGIHRNLRRMNRYGVLAQYLPEFGRIAGQMQHDLFHSYTVDAHTLNLIKHLRKLWWPELAEKYSLASLLIKQIDKPNLLYLAGLLHDIGKGLGKSHSEAGAEIATEFCARHNLNHNDTEMIVWLVRNHLLMSLTAQKQDITDLKVITSFAEQVQSLQKLDYLYLLTVADINATNPKLWNSWRASLLRQLYESTTQVLQQNIPLNLDVSRIKEQALLLLGTNLKQDAKKLWNTLDDNYLKALTAEELAWQTSTVLAQNLSVKPIISVRQVIKYSNEGNTQIFIHMPNQKGIFATTCATLSALNLQIFDARITTSKRNKAWDMYIVLDEFGQMVSNNKLGIIEQQLKQNLNTPAEVPPINLQRLPSNVQYFAPKPLVTISNDHLNKITVIEVLAADRLSMVAIISQVFMQFNLQVQHAKITTLVAKAQDSFFVLDKKGDPLSSPIICKNLQQNIIKRLSL